MARKRRRKQHVRIVEKKLARQRVWGLCYQGENLIELEERMRSKQYLKILCHELIHHIFPEASERTVIHAGKVLGDAIWDRGYRRIMQ